MLTLKLKAAIKMLTSRENLYNLYGKTSEDPGTYRMVHCDKPHKDITDSLTRKTRARLETPTYQLEPSRRVDRRVVELCMKQIIYKSLAVITDEEPVEYSEDIHGDGVIRMKYDQQLAAYYTKLIADNVRKRVKELNYDRYKYIVLVHIGQLLGEGVQIGTRSLWSVNVDQAISVTLRSKDAFCTSTLYAIYQE